MGTGYRIGRFTFNTYPEYVRALEDVKKIDKITHSVDIYEPETALRICQAIKDEKIVFHSQIGRKFYYDLSEIVKDSRKKAEESAQTKKAAKKVKRRSERTKKRSAKAETVKVKVVHTDHWRRILGGICLLSAMLCFTWYFWSDYTNHRGNEVNDYLKKLRKEPQNTVELVRNDTFFMEDAAELLVSMRSEADILEEEKEAAGKLVLSEYMPIYQENPDFAGWIKIEGTKVDNPVMLTRTDTSYYLNRNFNRQEDINGTLFMDARTNLVNRKTNIIVYGHNMKSGQMFGGLKKYLKEDYWKEHKKITFDTIYEKGTYEIFAVCLAQVQNRESDAFRYYDFVQADTEDEFNEFIQNIKELSVYTDQELPTYGDELLTLSTCNNYVEDGRLFVVAKKCRDAE